MPTSISLGDGSLVNPSVPAGDDKGCAPSGSFEVGDPIVLETPEDEPSEEMAGSQSSSSSIMAGTLGFCAVLAVDDATVVGVADDVLIPLSLR
jgi:hypothetical protein